MPWNMEWMRYAQHSLVSNLVLRCLKKKVFRYIIVYLALFSLVIFAELKVGFFVGPTCGSGAYYTVHDNNDTVLYLSQGGGGGGGGYIQTIVRSPRRAPPPPPTRFKLLPKGESVAMVKSEIFIPTALRCLDFPQEDDFTILLHGWARNHTKPRFSCCLLRTLNDPLDSIISTLAIFHKHNARPSSLSSQQKRTSNPNSKLLSTEFYCSLPKRGIIASGHIADFEYVTFTTENSCSNVTADVISIEFREKLFRAVGLCVSLPSTFINAEYLLEWIEWYRLQGALEVYVYYDHTLHKATRRIFSYYELVGFVKAIRLRQPPANEYDNEDSSLFDEDMANNDCRHRMSNFDYVITLELTELLAPRTFDGDIFDIVRDASKRYPHAGVFQIHTYQIILDWRPSKKTPLHLARHELRLGQLNMGEDEILSRWAYIPHRTSSSFKQRAWPKPSFSSVALPKPSYALLRFARCQTRKLCQVSKSSVKDKAISKFQNALINGMREIPIEYILPYNTRYVNKFHDIRLPGDGYFIGKKI